MNRTAKLVIEENQENKIEHQRRLELVNLEISKIQTLPAAYWPTEWRRHLERLSVACLALLHLMLDEQKAHEFDERAYDAINTIEEVFREMESANFTVTNVPPAKDDPAAERHRLSP
jgi:hypothetical protein